ncbi:MAG: DUF3089 domain-containing protein [Methanocalculaceae archaeon]|jgi:hypothetical protein|nr:DUF3089 domain-containing protein [Methanocalculaceae archaeon]
MTDKPDWKPFIRLCIGMIILAAIGGAAIYISGDTPETLAINYADPYNWYVEGTNPDAGTDVFYLYGDTDISAIKPYAINVDVTVFEVRQSVHDSVLDAVSEYPEELNAYIPYYRQMTAYSKLSSTPLAAETAEALAYADAKAAFHYYMSAENNGHPYVLAGSGQGADYISTMISEWFATRPAYLKNLRGVYLDGILQNEDDVVILLGMNV